MWDLARSGANNSKSFKIRIFGRKEIKTYVSNCPKMEQGNPNKNDDINNPIAFINSTGFSSFINVIGIGRFYNI